MAQSNAERYNVTVRIRIGFHRNELPTVQSLRPQCAHWGHLPLHKGGMRRCRASAINYNLACKNVTGHCPGVPDFIPARCAIVCGHCPHNFILIPPGVDVKHSLAKRKNRGIIGALYPGDGAALYSV